MPFLMRGAMIEYGSDFLGPMPNVVIFQFNPEIADADDSDPPRPTGAAARETTQAGEPSIEKITFKAQFSAADGMGTGNVLARTMGVGPRLAALEKMVNPASKLGGLIGAAIDAIGDALGRRRRRRDEPRQIDSARKVSAHSFHLGTIPRAAGGHRVDEHHRIAVRLSTQSDSGRRADRSRRERHRQLLGRYRRQGRTRILEHGERRAGDANLANTIEQIVDLIPF